MYCSLGKILKQVLIYKNGRVMPNGPNGIVLRMQTDLGLNKAVLPGLPIR